MPRPPLTLPTLRRGPRAPRRRGRLAAGLLAVLIVAGCAGDTPFDALTPPQPNVPEVPPDVFPTLGAPETGRPPPLNEEQRDKLQKDLENLAKEREKKVERSIEQGG